MSNDENETGENPTPGEGGWVPDSRSHVIGTVACAVCAAMAPLAFTKVPGAAGIALGMVCTGVGTGLAAWLGIKSAGPRKP